MIVIVWLHHWGLSSIMSWIGTRLGICSSVFQAIHSFFWAKEGFVCKIEQIAPVTLLSWATWANRSWRLFCHEQTERIDRSRSRFCKVQREWIPLSCSLKESKLVKSGGSALLLGIKKGKTVKTYKKYEFFEYITLFKRVIRSNHEQITHIALF